MANNFKITITAADKATATVRKIKDSIAQFTRPIRQVKTSIGALGRELGLDKVSAGLAKMARGATDVAKKAAGIVGAIAAVAGVTSLAAIAALTREWAFAGAEVLRTAGIIGTTTDKLQTLRGAASAAGLSADDLTGGLKSLGDTMEDALYGRNQSAMALMNRLSISMKRTKDGSVDTAAALYDVANAIQRTKNVQAQGLIARTFGVEALLPMLQKGAAGIREYEAAVRKSGAVMSGPALKAAQQFQYQIALLKLGLTGFANEIMGGLVPALTPMVQGMSAWVTQNKALIATNLRDFVAGVAGGVKLLAAVVGGVGGIVQATIGWKVAGFALAVVLGGRLLASIVGLVAPITVLTARLTFVAVTAIPRLLLGVAALCEANALPLLARAFFATGLAAEAMLGPIGLALAALTALIAAMKWVSDHNPHNTTHNFGGRGPQGLDARRGSGGTGASPPRTRAPIDPKAAALAMAYFRQQGWSKDQAAGIVGNFEYEGGLNPSQQGDGGAAYGIGQWHKDRQEAFRRFSGRDIRGSSLSDQLRFAQFELTKGAEKRAGDLLRAQKSARAASDAVQDAYERPSAAAGANSRNARQGLAKALAGATPPAGDAKGPAKVMAGTTPPAGGGQGLAKAPAAVPKTTGDAQGLAKALAGATRGGGGGPAGHVLTVKFENAPKGMKAEVKTASGGPAKATVKIDYAMAELSPP